MTVFCLIYQRLGTILELTSVKLPGRSQEQLENMMKDVTEAVHKNTGAPKEHIHVIINELGKHSYGQGGEWRA